MAAAPPAYIVYRYSNGDFRVSKQEIRRSTRSNTGTLLLHLYAKVTAWDRGAAEAREHECDSVVVGVGISLAPIISLHQKLHPRTHLVHAQIILEILALSPPSVTGFGHSLCLSIWCVRTCRIACSWACFVRSVAQDMGSTMVISWSLFWFQSRRRSQDSPPSRATRKRWTIYRLHTTLKSVFLSTISIYVTSKLNHEMMN